MGRYAIKPWDNESTANSHSQRYLRLEGSIKDAHSEHWLACERYDSIKPSERSNEKLDELEANKRLAHKNLVEAIQKYSRVLRVLSEAIRLEHLLNEVEDRLIGSLSERKNLSPCEEKIAEIEQAHQWRLEDIEIYEAHL